MEGNKTGEIGKTLQDKFRCGAERCRVAISNRSRTLVRCI